MIDSFLNDKKKVNFFLQLTGVLGEKSIMRNKLNLMRQQR